MTLGSLKVALAGPQIPDHDPVAALPIEAVANPIRRLAQALRRPRTGPKAPGPEGSDTFTFALANLSI